MRTTLTLDDDVAATLERLRRNRRISLKQLVNEALRHGLNDMGRRRRPREQVRHTRGGARSRARRQRRQRWRGACYRRKRKLQVILIDANILVYAHVSSFAQHNFARDWLDRQLNATAPVGLPWASILAFLHLVANPRVFESPEPIGEAWQQVRAWFAAEPAWVPQPTERHADLLGEFLALPGVHGNLVPDAHLAALAVEHGLTLCSTDGDFARFRGCIG